MNDELPRNPLITAAALRALHGRAFSWAMSQSNRSRSEAEDVLQQVYEQILSGQARFRGESALRTWLFAVVARTARGRRRGTRLRSLLLLRWWQVEESAPAAMAAQRDEESDVLWVRRALLAYQAGNAK